MAHSPRLAPPRVRYYSKRQKRRKSRNNPRHIIPLRLTEFAILFRSRYVGTELPNDDAGRDDIEPVLHHLASLHHAGARAAQWLELWAPWLTLAEQRDIISHAIATARAWTADELAWRYRITKQERDVLGLTTFGAIDYGKAARTKRRRANDVKRKADQRRAKGAKPRAEYEANAINRAKPWLAEGIHRATWYRKRKSQQNNATGPATA